MKNLNTVHEPLFHIVKRNDITLKRQILARVIAILSSLIFGSLLCAIVYGKSPIRFFTLLIQGNFKPISRIWELLKWGSLLLIVGLALIPAFKMKFWNLGGNGQILMGGLATIYCMCFLGGKLPDPLVWLIMLLSSILVGAIWAVIPAIFKAYFNTNESLFTLMMNYIASGLVAYSIKFIGGPASTGTIGIVSKANLPIIYNDTVLTLIVAILITVFITVYMKYSKHGYEISVVGDSQNTAKYIGLNVKKVIIRTLFLSGAICGVVGLLMTGAINHTIVTEETMSLSGFTAFTAIIAVWIAHNNPIATVGVSFGIMFITNGMSRVKAMFGIANDSVANMIIGIMYLFIIACEFFISYKLQSNKKNNQLKEAK